MAISPALSYGDPSIQQQYSAMVSDLECQELESPGGIATPQVYGQLLAIYLLQNDLPNAKFLWKRIPVNIKEANAELGKIWHVGQKLWNRDIPGAYSFLNEEWPDHLKPILCAIRDITRNRALQLVAKAYSSIRIEDMSGFLGLSPEECVEVVTSLSWEVDNVSKMIKPSKNMNGSEDTTPSEEQLAKLTEFVAFLEN